MKKAVLLIVICLGVKAGTLFAGTMGLECSGETYFVSVSPDNAMLVSKSLKLIVSGLASEVNNNGWQYLSLSDSRMPDVPITWTLIFPQVMIPGTCVAGYLDKKTMKFFPGSPSDPQVTRYQMSCCSL